MKTLKITMTSCRYCEYNCPDGLPHVICSECKYNCGYKHDVEGNLCVECGYNKDLSLKQNSNEGTRKTNGR